MEVYECIRPGKNIEISLKDVDDPLKAYREAYSIAADVLDIKRSGFWEKEFRFDATDGSFFARIEMEQRKAELDPYAKRKFIITMKGTQPLKEGEKGEITIIINALLIIDFPERKGIANTPLFKFLFNLWKEKFYNKRIEEYLKECYELANEIKNRFIELFE